MPQSIPAGLTKEHVLKALADLDAGVSHSFGDPTKYELVHEGKRSNVWFLAGCSPRHGPSPAALSRHPLRRCTRGGEASGTRTWRGRAGPDSYCPIPCFSTPATSQTLMVLSRLAETTRLPSGLNTRLTTSRSCPITEPRPLPVAASQSFTPPASRVVSWYSLMGEARSFPSGLNATPLVPSGGSVRSS